MHAPIPQIVDAWRRPMLRRLPVKCACSGLEIVSRSFARPRASLSVLHVRVCGHVCGGGNCKHGYVFYSLYPFMANGEYVGACGCAVHFVIVRRHMQNTTLVNGIFTLHSRCQIHWVYLVRSVTWRRQPSDCITITSENIMVYMSKYRAFIRIMVCAQYFTAIAITHPMSETRFTRRDRRNLQILST